MPRLDQQAHYVIRIQGNIDGGFVECFGPVKVTGAEGEGGHVISTLSGIVTDQAGLMGLLRHLHGLGVVLLSVERAAQETTKEI